MALPGYFNSTTNIVGVWAGTVGTSSWPDSGFPKDRSRSMDRSAKWLD